MFLTKIVKKTGLVDIGDISDGILAIVDFRNLIENPSFGIEAFTCVALTVDYMTPIRNYAYHERHKRAMRNVTGKNDTFVWKNELIQKALIAYSGLQYNDDLEEIKELQEMRKAKFREFQKEKDQAKKFQLTSELQRIKRLVKEFESGIDEAAILDKAPSKGDYNLKRLEQKLLNNKSFYHEQVNSTTSSLKGVRPSNFIKREKSNSKTIGDSDIKSESEPTTTRTNSPKSYTKSSSAKNTTSTGSSKSSTRTSTVRRRPNYPFPTKPGREKG